MSVAAVKEGKAVIDERDIIATWGSWYDEALASMVDIEAGGSSFATDSTIETARAGVRLVLAESLAEISE